MSLANKIAAASKSIGGTLKKDKANAEQGYRYVSADAILDAGGQALAEQGVTVYPGIVGYAVDPVMYKEGKLRYDARVDFLMRLADEAETVELPWVGMGSDYTVPDKALYKAITSGHRYFIGKLLNIGANNEDGEHETGDAPETHQSKSVPAPTCPKCGGAMWDNREKVAAGAKGPEWSCKKAGKWNPETKQRDGCPGVYWAGEWPPAEAPKPPVEQTPPTGTNGNGDKPAHWIDDATKRKAFWAKVSELGLSETEVHSVLGNSVRDFTGTGQQAIDMLKAVAAKKNAEAVPA